MLMVVGGIADSDYDGGGSDILRRVTTMPIGGAKHNVPQRRCAPNAAKEGASNSVGSLAYRLCYNTSSGDRSSRKLFA